VQRDMGECRRHGLPSWQAARERARYYR
jgi:hypothetical protein